jgi:polysaccharide biosynthesis transport protein
MDTIDRSNSNLPVPFHSPLSRQQSMTPQIPIEQAGAPANQISPRVILRALSRHWWRIIALWLVVSAPVAFLIYTFVKPTYIATSLLSIESSRPEVYGPLKNNDAEVRNVNFLQTQVSMITSEKVLTPAVADALVRDQPTIRKSDDPKSDLRKSLLVEIIPETSLIRVGLELAQAEEAVTIVQAVVASYLLQNNDSSRSANRELTERLKTQLSKLGGDIEGKKTALKELVKKGKIAVLKPEEILNNDKNADGPQSTFKKVSENQIQQMMAEMVKNDLELYKLRSKLEVLNAPNEARSEEDEQASETGLEARIQEEFFKEPDVQALIDESNEKKEQLDHAKDRARQPTDPARIAAQKAVDKIEKQYKSLWEQKYKEILKRLTGGADPHSSETIADLKLKVNELTKLKEKMAEQFKVMQVEQRETNEDTFEATYLSHQIDSLMSWENQVRKNLEQLKFEADQDRYRVICIDPASAPKTPSNNKALKYMAAAPVGVMFMMLALFLLLEIKAERVADPDSLSTRVRSEVYALPPLPTARSIRKLSESDADDQIEQFIQRLDHLRFAVCGTPAQLGKGRCVLITSAIGGEGKTTLAAQLAARCGNAGMSTLLIDSDFRRAALCPLLDVPEGPGLSDVLKDEATVDEVTIPVQGGTFYLLPAGTPIQDTSRVLQSPKFGQLMGQLRELYDLIIIDSPPVLPVPDALILGRWADGAVIAARYDISRFPQVERARRQLDNAGIAVLGTVINGMRHSDSYYGRYTYSRRRGNQPDSSNTI